MTGHSQAVSSVYYHCVLLLVGEVDLHDVSSAVTNLTRRWKDLGVSLGILLSDLDAIPSPSNPTAGDCLREMLALWLKQNYSVRTTHYAMSTIIS